MDSNLSIGNISFLSGASAFTIGGTNTLTVSNAAGITNSSATGQTFSISTIALGASQSWSVASTGNLSLTSAVTLGTNALTLAGSSTGVGSLSGVVGGTGTLTKSGTGTWTLSGANSYTGATTISQGTLQLNANAPSGSAGALGNASSAVLVNDASTGSNAASLLIGASGVTVGRDVTVVNFGTGISTLGGSITSGTGTFSGTTILNKATTLTAAGTSNLTFSGALQGAGAMTKTGTGAVTLSGVNLNTGGTTLSAGTLNLNSTTALGATGGAFTIAGGTIDNTSGGALTLVNNNTQNWNSDFTFTGTQNLHLGTGAVTMNASRQITTSGGTLTVGGAISGSGFGLTKAGAGTLVFGGTNAYSGGTILSAGTLTVNSGATMAAGTGGLTVNGGTLNLNNTAQTVSSFSGSGGTVNLGSGHTLTVNSSGSDSFSGALGGSGTLTKSGTAGSALTLSGNSSGYTGAINVTAGKLNAQGSNNALGTGTAGTTVSSGAALELQGGFTFNNGTLSLSGTGVGGTGALVNVSGANTWNNSLALTGSATIGSTTGTLTLGATRPFFIVSGHNQPTENGYVTIGGQTLTFAGAGDIVVNDRIRNFAGQIAGTSYLNATTVNYAPENTSPGNVVVNMTGSGSTSFAANANSYTGTTTVQAGTLVLRTKTNSAAPHDTVTDSFHSINGPLIIGSNSATTTATVQLGNGGAANELMAIGTTVTMYKDGTLNINGQAQTIDALTFNGGTVTLGTGTLYLNNDVTVNASAGNTASINGSSGYLSMTLNRAGGVDTGPDATRTFTTVGGVGNTYDLTIGGVIQSGNLVKAGNGTMMLNNNNTYTGTTSVTGGILNIQTGTNGSFRSGLGAGDGTAGQGTTVSSGATLQIQGGIAITSELLTLNGSGFNPGSGVLGALNNLSGSNTWGTAGSTYVNLASNSRINSSAGTLTVAGNMGSTANYGLTVGGSGNTTISGNIATGSGSTTTVTKDGSGTLILSGANSYQGATNITAGVVSVQNNNGLGAVTTGSNGTFVSSGAELQFSNAANGNLTIGGEALTLNGAGIGGAQGALRNIAGNNSFGGLITLGSASTIQSDANTLTLSGGTSSANYGLTVTGAGNTTISGNMTNGTGGLVKNGTGSLTFAGSGTRTGTVGKIDHNAGSITVGNGTNTTTLNANEYDALAGTTLTIASAGMVNVTQAAGLTSSFAGTMAGAGEFAFTGADSSSILALSNSFNASSLTLTLGGGTLSLLGGAQITFGTIHITGNTVLDFHNSAGTWLTSAALVIDGGVTVTVNNWASVADNTALSTIWYATSTVNAGSLGGTDQVGGTPLAQIAFTNYNGLTTTWVSGAHNGWFDHEIRPTPEPATYGALFLSGCLGLLGWRRWRSRRPSRA